MHCTGELKRCCQSVAALIVLNFVLLTNGQFQYLRPEISNSRARIRSISNNQYQVKLQDGLAPIELPYAGKIKANEPAILQHVSRSLSAPMVRVKPAGGDQWQQQQQQHQGRDAAGAAIETKLASSFKPVPSSKCQKRSLGHMMKSAKSLLTDGLEQYATRGNLMLASTLVAAAVPLVAFALPATGAGRGGAGSQRQDQTTGADGIGSWARRLALHLAQGGVQGRVDSVMGWIERSVEHLPNFPRLHPQECVKRSICEAHYEPERHGATGLVLRILFPATNLSSLATEGDEQLEYKVSNKYRHAAGFGQARRLDAQNSSSSSSSSSASPTSSVCREKYEDCVVSLLEVARNLIDVFLR